jgi:hypothetical protein
LLLSNWILKSEGKFLVQFLELWLVLVSAGRGVVGRWVFVILFVGGVGALQTLGLIVTLLNDGLLVLLVVSDSGNWDIPM